MSSVSLSSFQRVSLHIQNNVIGGAKDILDTTYKTAKAALLGSGGLACSVATLGLCNRANRWAKEIDMMPNLFGTIFYRTLKMANPYAENLLVDYDENNRPSVKDQYSTCSWHVRALLPINPSNDQIVSSRAYYLLSIPCFMIARIADLCLGAIGALFAVLSLGMSKEINAFAFKNLNVFYLLVELSESTRGCINPQALKWPQA